MTFRAAQRIAPAEIKRNREPEYFSWQSAGLAQDGWEPWTGIVNRDVKGGSVVRAKTLAVVVGLAVGTLSVVEASSDRFVSHTLLALGFDQASPTAQDLLRRGIDDYRWGRYDEASLSFEQASKLPGLSDREQEILAQYRALLVRVAKSRQEAGELLNSARRALDQGDLKQAESLATTVAANGYASPEVRDSARAILAKVQASENSPPARRDSQDPKSTLTRNSTARSSRAEETVSPAANKAKAKSMVAEAASYLARNELDKAEGLATSAKELDAKFYPHETSPDDILTSVENARRSQLARSPRSKATSQIQIGNEAALEVSGSAATTSDASVEESVGESIADASDSVTQTSKSFGDAGPNDAEAEVRQLIAQARKLMESGHLDEAEQIVAKAEARDLQWAPFDNPVQELRRDLAAAGAQGNQEGMDDVTGRSGDLRQEALDLLRQGRAFLRAGNLETAEHRAHEAEAKKATYRLLDDTPKQLLAEVARARTRQQSSDSEPDTGVIRQSEVAANVPQQRPDGSAREVGKRAQEHLKTARECMSSGDFDSAIEIARRVHGWGLSYGFWDDTPAKVESAALAGKNRAAARQGRSQVGKDRTIAVSLLSEARRDLKLGNLDAAEQKALQAKGLNVSYGMLSDRPDAVLADVRRARRASGADTDNHRLTPQAVQAEVESTEVASSDLAAKSSPANFSQPARVASVEVKDNPISEPPFEAVEWLEGANSSPLNAPRSRGVRQFQTVSGTSVATGPDVVLSEGSSPYTQLQSQQKLELARELFERGNYPRAREMAMEASNSDLSLRAEADDLVSRIGVAEQAMAIQLYEAGVAAARKKEYARALSFFQQVHASGVPLDPATEQQLKNYLRDLPARAGSSPRSDAGMVRVADGTIQQPILGEPQETGEIGQRERAKFQQLLTETNQKVQSAKVMLQSNPGQAIRELEAAQDAVRASGLDPSLTEPLARRLDTTIRYASQEKQRIELERVQKSASDATRAQRERQLAVEQHKQQEVFQLIEKGQAAMKEGRFQDAETAAKKALEYDPDNVAAIALHYKAKIESQLQIQNELRELKESRFLDTLLATDKSAVPFGDDTEISVRYPDAKKWEDLTESRKRRLDSIEKGLRSPRELEIERKLSEPLSVNFTDAPLGDVVAFLHDATGVNVFLDKHALAADGISSDKPITVKLENIPLRSALKLIMSQLDLEYMIRDDVLLITTPLKKQGDVMTKSYFVGDLVVPISAFPGVNVGGTMRNPGGTIGIGPGTPNNIPPTGMPMPNAALAQFGTGLGGSPPLTTGTGNTMPGYTNGSGMVGTPPGGMGTGQIVDFDSLIQLIEQTISPTSWSSVGGAGTIESFLPNLSLVVNQTQAIHEQISDLLTQLRRLQDLQVTVEVKFISLTEDFFERIGIDFDIDIDSDAQKPLRSFGSVLVPGSINQGGGGGGQTTITPPVLNTFYADHDDDVTVGLTSPRDSRGLGPTGLPPFSPDLKIPFRTGGFANGRPQGFVPGDGLNFGIAFLSDIQVYLFLEAAQQNNRGNVLTAPKVTLFNGQFAFVFSGSIEPFVTALNPVVAAGAVAFDPQIQQFFNGAFLGVQAVISADRRYVRLSLFPSFTNISGEKRFTVTGGAGGGGGFGGVGGGGGGAANAQAEIVVPIIAANFVFTTVSVPDGGTVMMGGLKTKTEIRNEFGTPILDKIPYVQRLFMNTGVASVTRSLLLMVTPRIIIQEEEEELLGKTVAF